MQIEIDAPQRPGAHVLAVVAHDTTDRQQWISHCESPLPDRAGPPAAPG
jgi:hypothetical protein